MLVDPHACASHPFYFLIFDKEAPQKKSDHKFFWGGEKLGREREGHTKKKKKDEKAEEGEEE